MTHMNALVQQLLDSAEELENEAERHMYEIHDQGILEELTPWMRRTGWIGRFDGRNMKVLNDLPTRFPHYTIRIMKFVWAPISPNHNHTIRIMWELPIRIIWE